MSTMPAARAQKASLQYPEKVWPESAAFGTLMAARVAVRAGPPLRLNLWGHSWGHSVGPLISAAPADPSRRLPD
jgi:hypothetical protein